MTYYFLNLGNCMPLIFPSLKSSWTTTLNVSPTINNRYGSRGHPYHTPLPIAKALEAFPLTTTFASVSFLENTFCHIDELD
jgi:hypothetical protein